MHLLKIQSKEDKEQFLLLHPHHTAESALHEQFLANAKTPNGYTNIKNALLISLAALVRNETEDINNPALNETGNNKNLVLNDTDNNNNLALKETDINYYCYYWWWLYG